MASACGGHAADDPGRSRASALGRKTRAERLVTGDPRLSLEERSADHDGDVRAVTAAANHAVEMGFLLPADRDAFIAQAAASNVLVP